MTCILQPKCSFLHGYSRCQLPVETIDIKVKVKMMQGIHIFSRDRTTQVIICNPLSTRLCPYPSLIRDDEELPGIKRKTWPKTQSLIPNPAKTGPTKHHSQGQGNPRTQGNHPQHEEMSIGCTKEI